MSSPFILLDLDGTISDPIEGIWRSINFALEAHGHNIIEKDDCSKYIGPPLDETFIDIVGTSEHNHISSLVGKYRERFSDIGYKENELYPGIREALQVLKDSEVQLGVCTTKRGDFANKILKMFGLFEYFSVISGGDIGINKAQQIRELLAAGLVPAEAIMVGDRALDLTAAHQNQINSAGVLWGYGSKEELQQQSPAFLLEKPEDLVLLAG